MSCKKYHDLMAAAALGDLGESERREFDTHLAGCDSCRIEFERLRRLTLALSADPHDTLSEVDRLRLENAVYRRLAEQSTARNQWPSLLLRVAAAVVLLGLGYLAHPLLSRTTEPHPTTITQPATPNLVALERDLPAGSRFTAAGFRVIAHGRKAALESLQKTDQAQPQ